MIYVDFINQVQSNREAPPALAKITIKSYIKERRNFLHAKCDSSQEKSHFDAETERAGASPETKTSSRGAHTQNSRALALYQKSPREAACVRKSKKSNLLLVAADRSGGSPPARSVLVLGPWTRVVDGAVVVGREVEHVTW